MTLPTGFATTLNPSSIVSLDTLIPSPELRWYLRVEKNRQIAEASIHVAGADLHAASEHDDMYASLDLLADKLDRQLLKHKEKAVARNHGAA